MAKKRILILGGGFGGVYVVVHLGKMLAQRELEETEIALVNRENYIVFQPLLPEVISGSVELNHVIAPIRRMAPRANLYTRDVESIDPVARTVTLSPGVRPTPLTLSEAALISNQPRNATIRATGALDTVAVSREAFQELLMHLPGLNSTIQELMSGRLKHGEDLDSMMRAAAAFVREDFPPTNSAR